MHGRPVLILMLILLAAPACRALPLQHSEQEQLDDRLTTQARNLLLEARRVNFNRIDVTVQEGVLYLSGESSSGDGKFEAEELARGLPGIKSVVNKLEVEP